MANRRLHQNVLLLLSLASLSWPLLVPSLYTGNYVIKDQRVTFGNIKRLQLEDNSADRDRSVVDMRAHQLFSDTYYLDCCPSVTQRSGRTYAINKHGLVIELFQTDNETQQFYETICRNDSHQLTIETTSLRRQCKFVDPRLLPYSRCVQQWSYVSALGRPFGRVLEQFSINYVRIRTGCNCQVSSRAIGVILDEHESTTGTLLSP